MGGRTARVRTASGTGRYRARRRGVDTLTAWLFISPSLLVIGLFGFFPVFFTLFVSLFRWRLTRGPFTGLANYTRLFGASPVALLVVVLSVAGMAAAVALLRLAGRRAAPGAARAAGRAGAVVLLAGSIAAFVLALPTLVAQGDKDVFDSLRVTVWYSAGTVPVQIVGGLLLALLLTRRMRGKQAFRVITLVPYIAPTVATAAVFELLFSLRPDSFANQLLKLAGIAPLQWLQEPKGILLLAFGAGAHPGPAAAAAYWAEWAQGPSLALGAIIIYSWWVFIGYYALIYMNGLTAIPRQLYEAAEVDGAGKFRSFFSITLPLLSPTTYFLSLLGVIGTFKAFTQLIVLRNSAAAGTVDPLSVSIYLTGFRTGNMGYASTISVLLFVIVVGLTLVQQRVSQGRVTYGD
jgi:multiple sugar transport system permease protein